MRINYTGQFRCWRASSSFTQAEGCSQLDGMVLVMGLLMFEESLLEYGYKTMPLLLGSSAETLSIYNRCSNTKPNIPAAPQIRAIVYQLGAAAFQGQS